MKKLHLLRLALGVALIGGVAMAEDFSTPVNSNDYRAGETGNVISKPNVDSASKSTPSTTNTVGTSNNVNDLDSDPVTKQSNTDATPTNSSHPTAHKLKAEDSPSTRNSGDSSSPNGSSGASSNPQGMGASNNSGNSR